MRWLIQNERFTYNDRQTIQMQDTRNTYMPINCGFHDYLEHFATLGKKVEIVYQNEDKSVKLTDAIIYDLTGGRNGEYAHVRILEKELKIRMDHIISIDDIKASPIGGSTYC